MSFAVEYKELWGVEVRAAGAAGPLAAFRVEPTLAGRATLAGYRMIARSSAGRSQVFYTCNPHAAEPLNAPITARMRVGFAVREAEPDAARNYLPELSGGIGPNVYAANLDDDGDVVAGGGSVVSGASVGEDEGIRIVPGVFTYRPAVVSSSDRLVVVSTIGTDDADREFEVLAGADEVSIDLTGGVQGPLEVGIKTEAARARVYADDELTHDPPVAVVDLYWETRQDTVGAGGVSYTLPLAERTDE